MRNFSNAFNSSKTVQIETTHKTFISLKVFNVLGNEIAILINEEKSADTHSVECNADGFPGGIYFYSLTAGNFRATKKMTLLK